jgi:transposase
MTITELTPRCKDGEMARRFEVFTGAGRRREWSEEEKRQIVEESYASELSVCGVARRHGLSPSQLFAWRRRARDRRHDETETIPLFVPAIVQSAHEPQKVKAAHSPSTEGRSNTAAIEMEIGVVRVKIAPGADAKTITAVLNALKAYS